MKIQKRVFLFIFIFLINLVQFYFVPTSKAETLDPYDITTIFNPSPTVFSYQRKSFYARGWQYIFFSNGTDMLHSAVECHYYGWQKLVPRVARKPDGSSIISEGQQFSIWWDGNYVHYALALADRLYYRRGEPHNGIPHKSTIFWETEQTAPTSGYFRSPYITVDSNGYPWIGYCKVETSPFPQSQPFVIKASAKKRFIME